MAASQLRFPMVLAGGLCLSCLWPAPTLGVGPYDFGHAQPHAYRQRTLFHWPQRRAPNYAETYYSMNSRYPKYTGAFHANYFRDMAIAPGDIGLRGNSIYATPW